MCCRSRMLMMCTLEHFFSLTHLTYMHASLPHSPHIVITHLCVNIHTRTYIHACTPSLTTRHRHPRLPVAASGPDPLRSKTQTRQSVKAAHAFRLFEKQVITTSNNINRYLRSQECTQTSKEQWKRGKIKGVRSCSTEPAFFFSGVK